MAWINVSKPNTPTWTTHNPQGKEQYDESDILYDDTNVFYDGVNPNMWTDINKPSTPVWSNISKPV